MKGWSEKVVWTFKPGHVYALGLRWEEHPPETSWGRNLGAVILLFVWVGMALGNPFMIPSLPWWLCIGWWGSWIALGVDLLWEASRPVPRSIFFEYGSYLSIRKDDLYLPLGRPGHPKEKDIYRSPRNILSIEVKSWERGNNCVVLVFKEGDFLMISHNLSENKAQYLVVQLTQLLQELVGAPEKAKAGADQKPAKAGKTADRVIL